LISKQQSITSHWAIGFQISMRITPGNGKYARDNTFYSIPRTEPHGKRITQHITITAELPFPPMQA